MKAGTLIGGKYRLSRLLGSGAMAEVWAAVHEGLGREVALKFILNSNEELRARMLREAKACGALKHPNIVAVLDVDTIPDGDPYLVMELLSGETLAELLQRQRRLDSAPAARIARDVARALVAAHGAGIVHRDLKPANIFLHDEPGPDGAAVRVVKVLDFGVAKNLFDSDGLATQTGGWVGSPAYMSPEQAQARKDVDYRSDLWSLGVVLFEMLTGKRPFIADQPAQLVAKIVLEPAPPVSKLVRNADPALVQLVSRCLERDRERRVQTAAQLVEALGPCCEGSSASAPKPPVESPSSASFQAPPSARQPAPSGPALPRLHADDDDGVLPTARLEPGMLGKLAPHRRHAAAADAPNALASKTLPLTDFLQPPAASSRPLVSKTLPLADAAPAAPAPPRAVTFGKPPPLLDAPDVEAPPSAIGKSGTLRMTPEHAMETKGGAQSVTGPLPVPPAPPPPASSSGPWPASTGYFDSSPSQPSIASVVPGIVSTTAPFLTVPSQPSPPSSEGAPAPLAPSRRRMGIVIVSVVLAAGFAILGIALVARVLGSSASASAPASASAVASASAPPSADTPAASTATAAPADAPPPAESASSSAAAPPTAAPVVKKPVASPPVKWTKPLGKSPQIPATKGGKANPKGL